MSWKKKLSSKSGPTEQDGGGRGGGGVDVCPGGGGSAHPKFYENVSFFLKNPLNVPFLKI